MKNWDFIFKVSLLSYLVFLIAEYARPGFVSFVASVHWWVVPIAISFVVLLYLPSDASSGPGWFETGLLSALFFFVVLLEGAIFEDFFLLFLSGVVLLPILLKLLLNQEEK